MPDPSLPAYVVVGHLARDVAPGGYTAGGTALYATLTARRLGLSVGVLTSVPRDVDLAVLEGAQVRVVPAEHATTFENRYGPDGRVQFLPFPVEMWCRHRNMLAPPLSRTALSLDDTIRRVLAPAGSLHALRPGGRHREADDGSDRLRRLPDPGGGAAAQDRPHHLQLPRDEGFAA